MSFYAAGFLSLYIHTWMYTIYISITLADDITEGINKLEIYSVDVSLFTVSHFCGYLHFSSVQVCKEKCENVSVCLRKENKVCTSAGFYIIQ